MNGFTVFLRSTIGRKQAVGVAGILLSLFILSHMLGNMLILCNPEAYNKYGHALVSNPFIYFAELGLVTFFLVHMVLAVKLSFENRAAKGKTYAVSSKGDKGTSLVQKTMWHQGLIILTFVVLHLITFKYGSYYSATYDGVEMRDLHALVVEVFQQPLYVVWYLVALLILGLHIGHGLSSSIQTLGFNHPSYTPKIELIGLAYSVIVTVGFLSQPLYVFFIHTT